jgi:CubicO group peptidase (beta-lactamase class C family)
MTKLFTATAVMQLRERGLVELDRAVKDYVQDFPLRSTPGREVTVRHLLSHSSGIANPLPIKWVHLADEPAVTLDALTNRLLAKYRRLNFEPGSRYAYSNLGYLVLGQLVERVSGISFPEYVQRHILDVLEMCRAGFSYANLQDHNVATGYARTFNPMTLMAHIMIDRRIWGEAHDRYSGFRRFLLDGSSYGGLLGSVSDLGNFMQAFLQSGIFQGRHLLKASTIEEMWTPQRDNQGREFVIKRPMPRNVGLGWHMDGTGERRHYYHLGNAGGFLNEVRLYPEIDYGIAVLGNETSYDTGMVTNVIVTQSK